MKTFRQLNYFKTWQKYNDQILNSLKGNELKKKDGKPDFVSL